MLHKEKCKRGSEPKSNSPSQVCKTPVNLFVNCSYDTRTYSSTTLTDSECKTLAHSDWVDELDCHLYVITRHAHLCTSWKVTYTCNVCCSEVELWTIIVEEWCMTTTLVLCQNVNLCCELCMTLAGPVM